MKSEQRIKLANRIARRLNASVNDKETEHADAARLLVDAIDKVCGLGYYDEATEAQVRGALDLIGITIELVNIDGVVAIESPATLELA